MKGHAFSNLCVFLCYQTTGELPEVNITKKYGEDLMMGECGIWEVEVTLPDAINFIGADIYAPLNESDIFNATAIGITELGMSHIYH